MEANKKASYFAEEANLRQEKHGQMIPLQSIFQHSPNAYILLTPDLVLIDINLAHLRLTGYERADVIGRKLFDVFPFANENQTFELKRSFQHVIDAKVEDIISLLHYPIVDHWGENRLWKDRYWKITNTPILADDGQLIYILNHVTDITHFVTSKDGPTNIYQSSDDIEKASLARETSAIDEERRRLRELMEQAPGFVAVGRGPHLVFELANKAYYQLVGNREIIGKPVREALPELGDQGIFDLLDEVYKSGVPFIGRAMPFQFEINPDEPLITRYIDFIYQPIIEKDKSVSGILVQGHDVTEAYELSQKLSYQATHDSLTGLLNRREFERQLESAIQDLSGSDLTHTLLYLDLDQFKLVNDTCGHQAGDEYLRRISMILASRIRPMDTLARLGGDEFSILLRHCQEHTALPLAEDLRQAVNEVEFIWRDRVFTGSISVGLIAISDSTTTTAGALSAADSACFLAKEKGRNRVQVYHYEDEELIAHWRQMDWVGRLRSALKEDRIELHVQMIQALNECKPRMQRYEVLMRLKEINGDLVPPMAFIPAAERYGLMTLIDRHIIKKVFMYLSAVKVKSATSLCLSINLSGATLSDESFFSFIEGEIKYWDIDPAQICFEITETTAISNLSSTSVSICDLKKLGFSFALDDFGSGMSSFGYLRHLPVDYLKIDGVFIRQILADKTSAAIVEAIAKVASVMGIQTVAEYVESEEVSELLASIGVDFAQGFGIHKPKPIGSLNPA